MTIINNKLCCLFFALCLYFSIATSEVVNFNDIQSNKNVVFFLSTPRSGSNVITGCLCAITRKPISWLSWGDSILDPSSKDRHNISYNRLKLPLISDIPLLCRTHNQFDDLMKVPSDKNKLILVTRNPKELIYRQFFLETPGSENPDAHFFEEFLTTYLKSFEVYEAWDANNRMLVFYEDFIVHDDEILLQLLQFMDEPPTFLEDFLDNKQKYMLELLKSYTRQHKKNQGGSSAKNGPQKIHYTKNASTEILKSIDVYIQNKAPVIWHKYLRRFKTK